MKVSILQTDIEWGDIEKNISSVELLLSRCDNDVDLFILPEMWSTGFATKPQGIAEMENQSKALSWMKDVSHRRRCAICGSLAVCDADGLFYNRHYFIDGRTETLRYYDKHHLFSYGHEDDYYTAGSTHTIVDYCGFRLLLLTCYDLRFPVWSRYGLTTGIDAPSLLYDAIVVVANWPQSRMPAWHILTRSRAIENQCYLIAANRVGNDSFSHYTGDSCIIDAIGRTLVQCRHDNEDVKSFTLDIEKLQSQRDRFRVLDDRDEIL